MDTIANRIQGNLEVLAKVKLLLSTVTIEAKSASEMVAADGGISNVLDNLSDLAKTIIEDHEKCECTCKNNDEENIG